MTRRKLEIISLKNDNARLRCLIKAHEWAADYHGGTSCPWCSAAQLVTELTPHAPECPAFTPEGLVR